jgi:hypothetical protein
MSLNDDEIITTKVTGRRSFLSRVGTVILGSAAVILGSQTARGTNAFDSDTGRPPDNKAGKNPDHDKREPGDTKKKTKDSDQGRAPDNKASKGSDHDKREPGDPK